jgi:hypothetical protein
VNTFTKLSPVYQPRHLWAKIWRFGDLFCPHHQGEMPHVAHLQLSETLFRPIIDAADNPNTWRQSRTANSNFCSCTVNTGCGDKCTSLLAGLNVALQESALQDCGRKEEEHPSPRGHDGKVKCSRGHKKWFGPQKHMQSKSYIWCSSFYTFPMWRLKPCRSFSRVLKEWCIATLAWPHHVRQSYRML